MLVHLDFIGDIHGHFVKFKMLLERLGYNYDESLKTYTHPQQRKIVVLGDFINVGMQNKEILYTLYQMHTKQQALIIAGNHEYFLALLYHKTINNKNTLWYYIQRDYFPLYIEYNNKKEDLYPYIEWMLQLPLFIDFENAKAIHAIWDENNYNFLKAHNTVKEMIEFIAANPEYKERLNKAIMGITIKVNTNNNPKATFFRYKWWENNQEIPISELFIHKKEHFTSDLRNEIDLDSLKINIPNEPIFFGHYNLRGFPYLTNPTKCCLDFGGAKGGYLTAYRWDGETILDANKIIYV